MTQINPSKHTKWCGSQLKPCSCRDLLFALCAIASLFASASVIVLVLCTQVVATMHLLLLRLVAGWRLPKQTNLWFKVPGAEATQVLVSGNQLDVARAGVSAGLKADYWACLQPLTTVHLYRQQTDGWVPCATCCPASCLKILQHTGSCFSRPPKLLQVVNVDHYGFALLNMEKLGGLGGSRESPIILKLSKPKV